MRTSSTQSGQNPLAVAQRETSGAQTFDKYEYQYHWALCRLVDAHKNLNDYVVFIELHEDVVFSSSTDKAMARFEFSQIKNISGPALTARKLTNVPKGSKNTVKNSILGKMIKGVNSKIFFDKLDYLDLVATSGFNLAMKSDELNISVITLGDLHDDCLKDIQMAIEKEIEDSSLPKVLRFVRSDLPAQSFRDVTIGRISKLVDAKNNGQKCNATTIYRVLIDDLHLKGAVALDFTDWTDMIKNKGITYSEVEKIISANTENKGIDFFEKDLSDIFQELEFKAHQKIEARRSFERHYNALRLERNLAVITLSQFVKDIVLCNLKIFKEEGVKIFLDRVLNDLKEKNIRNIEMEEIKIVVIYELLSSLHEK